MLMLWHNSSHLSRTLLLNIDPPLLEKNWKNNEIHFIYIYIYIYIYTHTITLKGMWNSKWNKFSHWLTPILFQTCMTFFFLWNVKEDILKNVGNQTVSNEWELRLCGCQISFKIYSFVFHRRKKCIYVQNNLRMSKPWQNFQMLRIISSFICDWPRY